MSKKRLTVTELVEAFNGKYSDTMLRNDLKILGIPVYLEIDKKKDHALFLLETTDLPACEVAEQAGISGPTVWKLNRDVLGGGRDYQKAYKERMPTVKKMFEDGLSKAAIKRELKIGSDTLSRYEKDLGFKAPDEKQEKEEAETIDPVTIRLWDFAFFGRLRGWQ